MRRHDPPPSSERQRPVAAGPTMYIRCAFVFIATAAVSRPESCGRPPPLISFHVIPSSTDLNSLVPLAAVDAAPAPAAPAARPPRLIVVASITLGWSAAHATLC